MDDMRNFKIQTQGGVFDAETFPDMPESVKAYMLELKRQLEENGAEGVTAVPGDHIPPEVNDYFVRVIRERAERGSKDPDSVTVAEFPLERYEKLMGKSTEGKRRRIEEGFAKTPEMREYLRKTTGVLRTAFLLVMSQDSDWRALGVRTADMLWQGVANAVLYAAAHTDDPLFEDIMKRYRAEDGGDENDEE